MSYSSDSKFSNSIHNTIGAKIYNELGWTKVMLTEEKQYDLEMNHGVNHVYMEGITLINVQERFRDTRYSKYTDFTLRYRRDTSNILVNKRSEFFKTKANYLVYGIVNSSKTNTSTNFIKYVIVDFNALFELVDSGKIVISEKIKTSCIINEILHAPLKHNHDGSSSFVALDIILLKRFPNVIFKTLNY